MISYKYINTLLEKTENKKDIDFYIELQDLVMRSKQKEAIEKGIY